MSHNTVFFVKREWLFARDLRERQNGQEVSSSLVAPVAHALLVSLTIHERRFTPKSSESAMAAEAFMNLSSLIALTAYQRCVIPTALAYPTRRFVTTVL